MPQLAVLVLILSLSFRSINDTTDRFIECLISDEDMTLYLTILL
jgi:hypothetical protein